MKEINAVISLLPWANLFLLVFLCLFFGRRFYRALKPVAQGIEAMSMEQKIELSQKGMLSDLCREINKASELLDKQHVMLTKREDARTEWISGVSHDIRTPLSMIMGYADDLSNDESLSQEQMQKAEIIRKQSLIIKELIEDLNLTSKLEYQMQPLRMEECRISGLLREIVADYCNSMQTDVDKNAQEKYEIELEIEQEAEKYQIRADRGLLGRAFRNLIGNSIRHNPQGCKISIFAKLEDNQYLISYKDNGKGIPKAVWEQFHVVDNASQRGADIENHPNSEQNPDFTPNTRPHIMGLFLIQKIVLAHGGKFVLKEAEYGMYGEIML